MPFDYLGRVEAINPTNLTIRERTRLASNPLALRYRDIFPRVPTPSIKVSEIEEVEYRFGGGRREWNAQGREIPTLLGPRIDAEMVPINPTKHFDERYLQRLGERARGMDALVQRDVISDVDGWATILSDAADRQLEIEGFQAWFQNQITVMDPKTGTTVTMGAGVDASRYVAAGTTLAAATSAYTDFMGYLADAQATLGSVGAVRMRRARLNEILADAPAFAGDQMSVAGLQQRINDEGFGTVEIIVDERTYEAFDDGGSASTTSHYVPADRIAFQPATGVVGRTFVAPVERAYQYVDRERVDANGGVAVFYSPQNDGKTLLVEAQENSLILPLEPYVYVVTGVA